MLVVEVLKTVGQLAAAITQKSKELDLLKAEYESKLKILDEYITKVVPREEQRRENGSNEIDTCELLQKELRCLKCQNIVYSLKEETDYVLVPRKVAERKAADIPDLIQSLEKLETSVKSINAGSSRPLQQTPQVNQPQRQNKKQHGKLKRTCSYCDDPGHTRARCFARLSKEPGSEDTSRNRPAKSNHSA